MVTNSLNCTTEEKRHSFHFVQDILTLCYLKSDKHLISPYNITPESNINVTRIKEMITN